MSIERRPHKRHGTVYAVRVREPGGRVVNKTFRTKKEAERWEREQRSLLARGGWIDPRGGASEFAVVAKNWLEANPAKRESGWARDESIVRNHLLPVFGDRAVASLTRRDIQDLVNGWVAAELAPRTVRRQYGVLRAVLNSAVDHDLILRSPCRNINLPEVLPIDRRIPDAAELATLADELGDYAPMVWIGAVLGLRWGEVAGLRVRRLDLLRHEVMVAEQLTRGRHGAATSGPPKSAAGRRTLSMPRPLSEALAAHLVRRGLTAADGDALVFVAPMGGPLQYDKWRRRVWGPACKRAGLPGLCFHDLRRTNASALVADRVDLKVAQKRLGHSDPRLTLGVYAQATSDADRSAARRLGAHLMPSPTAAVRRGSRGKRAEVGTE